ncbi:radical SAM protein [Chloroflexota bacterium]
MTTYPGLLQAWELGSRVTRALSLLESCSLCPRNCPVNRLRCETGKCPFGRYASVSSPGFHFGEEYPLSGVNGSGTICFTRCNLKCVFCQNSNISQKDDASIVTKHQLARIILGLQALDCHNINLISPTHVVPQILEDLEEEASEGLTVPIVYNSGGYDSPATLALLDGVVDIYKPDMKYSDEITRRRYSGVRNYPEVNWASVLEMHRQVGNHCTDKKGIAVRGLLVRHPVLPHDLAGTRETVRFLAGEISRETYLNIMAQYHPSYRASSFTLLDRPVTGAEFKGALIWAAEEGLERLDHRTKTPMVPRF